MFNSLGYDKLKPYGFPIHGAIDGYSRKILWLELTKSNNKPENVAKSYIECVKGNGGCPLLLTVTEHIIMMSGTMLNQSWTINIVHLDEAKSIRIFYS